MTHTDAFEHDKEAINNFTAQMYSQLLSVTVKKLSQPENDFTGKQNLFSIYHEKSSLNAYIRL